MKWKTLHCSEIKASYVKSFSSKISSRKSSFRFTSKSIICSVDLCVCFIVSVQFYSFACEYPDFPHFSREDIQMTNRYRKMLGSRYIPINREWEFKITMIYRFKPLGNAIIQKQKISVVRNWTLSHCWGECKMVHHNG